MCAWRKWSRPRARRSTESCGGLHPKGLAAPEGSIPSHHQHLDRAEPNHLFGPAAQEHAAKAPATVGSQHHMHRPPVFTVSGKGVAVHGDDVVADAPEKRLGLCIGPRRAQSGEQRQQVFIGGMGTLTDSLLTIS